MYGRNGSEVVHAVSAVLLQSPAVAGDCYVLVVLFLILFFRPPIIRRPWADFRETLPQDAVCPEIVYFL